MNKQIKKRKEEAMRKKKRKEFLIELTLITIIILSCTIGGAHLYRTTIEEEGDLATQAQRIFDNLSTYESFGCYSGVGVSEPTKKGFFSKLYTVDLHYEVYLKLDEEFTKECYKEYASFRWNLNHSNKYEREVAFDIYINDKDGRTFTYENYKDVNINSEDDFLTYRTFVK